MRLQVLPTKGRPAHAPWRSDQPPRIEKEHNSIERNCEEIFTIEDSRLIKSRADQTPPCAQTLYNSYVVSVPRGVEPSSLRHVKVYNPMCPTASPLKLKGALIHFIICSTCTFGA
eukprot:1194945-Prorocentrum_minimum.AAC.7